MTATGRLHASTAFAIGGVGVCVVGTLLPWLRSGERSRSSYQLAGLVGRVLDGPAATLARAWLAFPMLAAAAVAALLIHPGRLVLLLGALVAAVAAAFAFLVGRAPLPGLVGLRVTYAGAVCVLAALAIAPGPSSSTDPTTLGANLKEQH